MAGEWLVGPRTPSWVLSPTIGNGVDMNGGDPPYVTDHEPAPIDEVGYTREDWLQPYPDYLFLDRDATEMGTNGGGKFRITLFHHKFGRFDPIVMPGMSGSSHLHEFFGNMAVHAGSTWETLREVPGSNNYGGPLNSSAYWVQAMLYDDPETGMLLPIKSDYHALYYNLDGAADPRKVHRLPRGLKIIGGVDPADRYNLARCAEVAAAGLGLRAESWTGTPGPDGVSDWDKRLNGFTGWQLYNPATGLTVPAVSGHDADSDGAFPRQLVNYDGSDPWDGTGEDPNFQLIAHIVQPTAWDGWNDNSPNGRNHLRYETSHPSNGNPLASKGPDGWWKLPHVENKGFYPNTQNGVSGHAFRSRFWCSSDLYNMDGSLRDVPHPQGSTPHFDLIPAWDDEILTGTDGWQHSCPGIAINGVIGAPADCDTGTINSTHNLTLSRPSGYGDDMAPADLTAFGDSAAGPTKDVCGIPVLSSRIPMAVSTS